MVGDIGKPAPLKDVAPKTGSTPISTVKHTVYVRTPTSTLYLTK